MARREEFGDVNRPAHFQARQSLGTNINTTFNEASPSLSLDEHVLLFASDRPGLEMFLTSDRPGTLGGLDLWVSTRATTTDPWSAPINLGLCFADLSF